MGKKRIAYIDIAKALAIAFIIIGHTAIVYGTDLFPETGIPFSLRTFSFTFHLPVFFVVSGYFFQMNKQLSKDVLAKDFRNLIVPYIVTCALIVIGCVATAHMHGLSRVEEAQTWLAASLYGSGGPSDVQIIPVIRIGGIWFLLALFWTHIFITATAKLPDLVRLAILAMLALIAVWSAPLLWLPFSIQSGMGCAIYVFLGMLARKHDIFARGKIHPVAWVVIATLWLYVIVYGGFASLAMQIYPLGVVDFIGALAATLCVVVFSRKIEEHVAPASRFFSWIGRNTLAIFALHIVEDNVIRWQEVGIQVTDALGGSPYAWIALIAFRFLVDAAIVGVVYFIPVLNRVYFPQLR